MLLVGHGAFVVPVWDILVEIVSFNHTERVFGCRIGINNCLNKGVRSQAIATMQTRATALTHRIQAADRGLGIQVHLDTAAQIRHK